MSFFSKLHKKLKRIYALKIERLPYVHWFNPLQTLYVNLKCFPLRQAIKMPLFVYGWTRIYSLYGSMECIGTCKCGMVKFNKTDPDAPGYASADAELNLWGKIQFMGSARILAGTKVMVGDNGVLRLGDDVRIMSQSNVSVYKSVSIGEHSRIACRTQIIDSNFHYIADFEKREVRPISKDIVIGAFCWICNSSTLSGGTKLPNNSIISSNSLVNKDFSMEPLGVVIGGMPAKVLCRNRYRVFNSVLEQEINDYFASNDNKVDFPLSKQLSEKDVW